MEGTSFGRYRLITLLGRGGMGEVWRAYDTATNRTVAIKLLPPYLAHDDTFVQRFRREAEAAAQLSNPHVIPIHNYGEIDGRLYVDMRLVEGRDLQEVLADGPLGPERSVRVVEQVANALHAAHRIGLVHRDVKPSNILLDEDDFAYLIDFGIARGADQTSLTSTGGVIGTWHYMAPERLSAREADARSDIYALACVLHECLTGKRPFPGDSLESQVAAHLTTPPPRPSTIRAGVPAELDPVIAKGMAKNPDKRYATALELGRDARDAVTAQPPRQTPTEQAAAARTAAAVPHHERPQPTPDPFTSKPTQRRRSADNTPKESEAHGSSAKVLPRNTGGRKTRWRRRTVIIAAVLPVLLILAGLAIGREIVRSNYYVTEHDGIVSIMRGVQGSFLGVTLQEPYLLGCLNARNELSLISAGTSQDNLDCRPLGINDMRPSERAQVAAGLPSGSLDDSIAQIEELARSSVLPICAASTLPTTDSRWGSAESVNPGIPEVSGESPAPGAPTTATAPAPTVTALPPPPPEPGTNCRQVS
ncbi:serine/threonine protein kinase [Mycobacterium sp. OAS707]|uniref:serine/threonine-protein kinase n=1 Tax=Mycobacterium sp. OAS707 TaxID=2663822 RepID=UPI00178BB154|nr:serine/threonine protein kinase [Mycobacterium sp. OAS707]